MRIGIALVEKDGSYLIGRRRADGPLAGYWEFPGGKCRPGEPPDACAERECCEETGLRVEAQQLRRIVNHRYEHGTVELYFYDCQAAPGQQSGAPLPPFRWVRREHMVNYTFPPANETVLQDLLTEHSETQERVP
jgi:8-oxo-dGTP diphosphatase